MANSIWKTVLNLLLLVTLVTEPAAFSYAMAGMDHDHHQCASMAADEAEGHHTMHKVMAPTMDHADNHKAFTDDCCGDAACCHGMMVISFDFTIDRSGEYFAQSSFLPWEGVALSSETKPPRHLLA